MLIREKVYKYFFHDCTNKSCWQNERSFYGSGNIAISDIQIAATVAHCKNLMRFQGEKIELQKKWAQKSFE